MNVARYLQDESSQRSRGACIEACIQAWIACESCASACLGEDQVKAMVACIRSDWDCAAACRNAVEAMVRGSELAESLCRICERACVRCAGLCDEHEAEHCRACAEACRRCAQECRALWC